MTQTSWSPVIVTYPNFTTAYLDVLKNVSDHGQLVKPRDLDTSELLGYAFRLEDSRQNLVASPTRKLSYAYALAEWLWIQLGRSDLETIGRFSKRMAEFSDDGRTLSGAYGPQVIEQWSWAKRQLIADADTRQCVINLWRPRPARSKDIPCTISLKFYLRSGKLNLIGDMRSNDAWLGLPYDLFTFTQLQQQMAAELGVEPGWYQHQAGSMHLYGPQWGPTRRVIEELNWQLDGGCELPPGSPNLTVLPAPVELAFLNMAKGADHPSLYKQVFARLVEDLRYDSKSVGWIDVIQAIHCKLDDTRDPTHMMTRLQDISQATEVGVKRGVA
jgi:thymidylate synthase